MVTLTVQAENMYARTAYRQQAVVYDERVTATVTEEAYLLKAPQKIEMAPYVRHAR